MQLEGAPLIVWNNINPTLHYKSPIQQLRGTFLPATSATVAEVAGRNVPRSQSLHNDNFVNLREKISNLIWEYGEDFNRLGQSDDIALRKSYYSRFHCKSTEEIDSILTKDGAEVYYDLISNEHIMKSKEFVNKILTSEKVYDYDHGYLDRKIYELKKLRLLPPEVKMRKRIYNINRIIKNSPAVLMKIERLTENIYVILKSLKTTVLLGIIRLIIFLTFKLF